MRPNDTITTTPDQNDTSRPAIAKKRRLAPFTILKRLLAGFVGFLGMVLLGSLLFSATVPSDTENDQIMNWILALAFLAIGAWLWGGRDPD